MGLGGQEEGVIGQLDELHQFRAVFPSVAAGEDEAVLFETNLRRDEFEREAPLLLAAKLFELGRLSSGRAAQLCGLKRVEFLMELRRIGVAMSNMGSDDIDDEVRFAQRA